HNAGRRPNFVGYSVRSSVFVMIAHGLLRWAKAELAHLWSFVVPPRGRGAAADAAPLAGPERAGSSS
ncbi:MAG TPA: hypothetical protein VG777_03215, partial [Thermoanaerobaculia bacterium]|nr:hypothetical protein [Thermoanaerobaculia bacterium]